MLKAGSILILIIFILESLFIVPLLWTIPGFILYKKIRNGTATADHKIALAIIGIIFGAVLGIIGGILILFDLKNDENKVQRY